MAALLLLALACAGALTPAVLRARAARRDEFLVSFGAEAETARWLPPGPQSPRVRRRRRIAGSLLMAMAATLLVGLLPGFRALLVVHLFLVDSFLAYVALLAHQANRAPALGLPALVTPP